ncbi:DNA-binding protein [Thiorhodovibrio frisius]|uniref:HTH merR-type domain-containing protein n=1 Tax=Thiorhodovibrio frisius TaxID=631362 RepID=H8YWZ2_9GAMM|nr:DNA-binding protein [Thiorhodovibrio frisius]EIC22968.1 hypothetical protein Thi970DRAFT_00615 [Thiorhodovibrio frisius]WPL22767.1 hypothetical protein Thiofri_02937 [Thiorhodovibrio frisius]
MSTRHAFTTKDVCAALKGVSRSRVHAWVQLPPFSGIPTQERSARRFNKADLLTFAALRALEDCFGARSAQLAQVSAGIHQYLSTPRQTSIEEWIFIPLDGGTARPSQPELVSGAGWVIDMARERERVDRYLGFAPPQRELPLMAGVGQSGP